MGVEQIGRPVQGHCRLSGAGSALHDEHPAQRRPDDLVLLSLDRRDDVRHTARPGSVQRREQRGGSPDGQVAHDQFAGAVDVVFVARIVPARQRVDDLARRGKPLVFDADHLAPLHGQMATQHEAQRIASCRPVERLRHGRTPVDHQRLVVRAVDGEPSDMEGLAGRDVAVG